MKALGIKTLTVRILLEAIGWAIFFVAILAIVGLALNVWESPRDLLNFLGSGRTL